MRKMLRSFFYWIMHDTPDQDKVVLRPRTPFDQPRTNSATTFTIMKAENGMALQTYDYNNDRNKLWIIPEGSSVGNMVDVVLVAEKLK